MRALEYAFDFSCPFAYLASTQVEALAARTGATLVPRPILLGGVFKSIGVEPNLAATLSPAKAKHNLDDMRRFAALFGVPLVMPAGHPLRTVGALRALLAVGAPFLPLAHRFFRAYWAEGIDISTEDGIARVLREAGHDAAAVLARAESQEIKDELRRRTDEAVARGVFGVPAFFVGEDVFFGQDRMSYVEEALGGTPSPLAPPLSPGAGEKSAQVDFWFDYSSPFTYLGSERVEDYFGDFARWRPMLLGGLFKKVGQVDVPLFAMTEAKRRHAMQDLVRQAARAKARFQFPARFPMNTVLALRATLAAEELAGPLRMRELAHRIFRAFWADDRDISDPAVVAAIAGDAGFDGAALIARAGEQAIKDRLRANTDEAAEAGAFGAPTFVVHGEQPALYWGADRIELAALAARGDRRVF
jgi:2-hydroxychromene-2-carboxylate isomerase